MELRHHVTPTVSRGKPNWRLVVYGVMQGSVLTWYLMTAPYTGSRDAREINPAAPLIEWHILAPYDSIDGCEAKRRAFFQPPTSPSLNPKTIACIAGDNPHLKFGGRLPEAGAPPVR